MNLVINSFGAALSKENDLFLLTLPDGKQTIPPSKVKSITIHQAVRISSDAILLAIRHEIDVLFVNESGKPEGRLWSVQYGSISNIRRAQLDFFYSNKALAWVKDLLMEKLNNQIAILLFLQPESAEKLPEYNLVKYAINSIEDHKRKIASCEGDHLTDLAPSLRGWEGAASRKYFSIISAILPHAYRFETRSRQPATDVFNCLLNYAYGILYARVEGALIKAGIDPYVGIFHRDEYNRPALVFDVIEKYRIWMDFVVIQLCRMEVIDSECFEPFNETGALRLESFGKRILIQAVNDYLAEIIVIDGLERSRLTHLEMQQSALAQFFLKVQAKGKEV